MSKLAPPPALRRMLLSMSVGLVILAVFISAYLTSTLFIKKAKDELLNNTRYWAEVVAQDSIENINNNTHQTLVEKLSRLKSVPYIQYIHIYKLSNKTNEIEYFSSYNGNEDLRPIPDKISEINNLSKARITKNFIELIIPIHHDSKLIGYIYIQTALTHITAFTSEILSLFFVLGILSIIITIFMVLKIENYITLPIKNITTLIQSITKSKNYQLQCPPSRYKEIDILSRNINILLNRINNHIKKTNESKDQSEILTQRLEEKVSKRTDALKESNQELLSTLEKLHQFQGQLVESEKMASLGDMVAGVAHEVNTPIGLGVTASTLLSDRLNDIKNAFENKSLRSSQLKKFLNEGQENVGIIYRNLNRAADLILSFKKVAVDQSSEDIRTFVMDELLNEVLLTLAPQIKATPFIIELNCPTELSVTSKPGPINQILINLILNSIIHGFENKNEGTIKITIMPLSGQLNIHYQDDGIGIEQTLKHKVFEPFTTTKRGEGGSGLGLHLVYNLVTQALGGSIHLESEVDNGVNFDINFPIN